jgi:hypothetical protein
MNTRTDIMRHHLLLLTLLAVAVPVTALGQTDRTFEVRAGARLDLEAQNGSITVRTWDRSSVRLRANNGPDVRVVAEQTGNAISIRSHGRSRQPRIAFELTVPRAIDLTLHTHDGAISVEGAGGRVEASSVKGGVDIRGGTGIVEANSVQGGVTIRGARGQVEASSVNAGITIEDVTGAIEASTVNGSATLRAIDSRQVEASTVNGSIVYDGTIRPDGHYVFSSHNGPVTVTVPAGAGADVSVSTFNGSFSASFPITFTEAQQGKSYRFVLGSGGAHIQLDSFNGSIRLRRPGER